MTTPFKSRFAPSPTGLLHLGNVRTALFSWLAARRHQGSFLLRIEDTDATRGHEKFTDALKRDLRWLGLDWSEGPDVGGNAGPYAQSERSPVYEKYFDALSASGELYPCFCSEHELEISRKTQIAAGRPPRYSGRCRALSTGDVAERRARGVPATLRFRVPDGERVVFEDKVRGHQEFPAADIGDFIVRRSDGTPAFFFCNAIDDAVMGVTMVLRGEDHLTNTPRQIMLLQALKLPVPEYAHIALVVGADGAPLSKRTGSLSVEELRARGYLPMAVNNYLARLGHTYESNELMDARGLAAQFELARLHKAPARFDEQHLRHWQRETVRMSSAAELWAWLAPSIGNAVPMEQQIAFVEAVRGNIVFPPDALHWAERIYAENLPLAPASRDVVKSIDPAFLDHTRQALVQFGDDFKAVSSAVKLASGLSGKALFQPLRAVLTGELDGPEMAKLLPLIGRERAQRRVDAARHIQ